MTTFTKVIGAELFSSLTLFRVQFDACMVPGSDQDDETLVHSTRCSKRGDKILHNISTGPLVAYFVGRAIEQQRRSYLSYINKCLAPSGLRFSRQQSSSQSAFMAPQRLNLFLAARGSFLPSSLGASPLRHMCVRAFVGC